MVLAVINIACSRKTIATKEGPATESTGVPQPEVSKPFTENVEPNLLAAGQVVYETKCTRCHALKVVDLYTPQRWDGILKIMVPKAKLTESEAGQVTAYVRANAKK